jgi:hypothetical protein
MQEPFSFVFVSDTFVERLLWALGGESQLSGERKTYMAAHKSHYQYQGNHPRFSWNRNRVSNWSSWLTRGVEFFMVMSTLLWAAEVNASPSRVVTRIYAGPSQWLTPQWLLPDELVPQEFLPNAQIQADEVARSPAANSSQGDTKKKRIMRVDRLEHATSEVTASASAQSTRAARELRKLRHSISKSAIAPDPEHPLSPSYKSNPFYVPSDLTLFRF